jgi:hypothetical protein
MTVAVRKSVPLTEDQAGLLADIRIPRSPVRLIIEEVVGPLPENLSEARALSGLLDYAAALVAERRRDAGYAALAAARDEADTAHDSAVRARRGRLDD